ncbi:N-carbamoyl-L-amino acid hydrolase [Mannheimia haemolytica]|uniref:N-carbamoyl-L-amino acid hydrolase n=1 Tax=Mannheimia haemolytica TaxID=75985 RepID=A0A448TAY4_MANHA|nr:M20 family metallo-hydrolase [Mannheimia haemolytica]VEI77018.1 N-carbamoyl-L-amino acid hydrolase [Mannheimia haemolytica]
MEQITQRITQNLEHLKQFTATPGNGCTRLPFSQEARSAVNYLRELMIEAGLQVKEDEAGNIFGILAGEQPELPCVMSGSHYDSVLHGGNYDGIAGVITALETARLLKATGKKFKRNFVVVGFNDEEGMRFGTGYFGSGAMLGLRTPDYCRQYKDKDGISYYEAMQGYGLDPEKIENAKWAEGSIGHFIETHIEQGPVLDTQGIEIGLVTGIVGLHRHMFTVHGRADHAGTTPMDMRLDAVDVATKVIAQIADWAREKNDGTVATVGYMNVLPGGINIVAEKVVFSVDIRSLNMANVEEITAKIEQALAEETAKIGSTFEKETKLIIQPVALSEKMLDILENSAQKHQFSYKRLPSGAGHDSLEIGQKIPTVMIFVLSKDGRSHTPVEFTEYHYFAKAAVLQQELAEQLLDE